MLIAELLDVPHDGRDEEGELQQAADDLGHVPETGAQQGQADRRREHAQHHQEEAGDGQEGDGARGVEKNEEDQGNDDDVVAQRHQVAHHHPHDEG